MAGRAQNLKRKLVLGVVLLVVWGASHYLRSGSETEVRSTTRQPAGTAEVEAAAARQSSGVMVDATGVVQRTLSDDNEGSRHQRFVLELPSGHTVLVAHNIDLATRVPLSSGDQVALRGQYEWNARGGVVHWTHHDPAGRHEGGWIEYQGRRYD